ncbi:MAG: cysteine--tRNA ligase, partial [Haliangium ochraceum]
MSLRIFDTREKRKIDFVPLRPGKASMYACGVTVYDVCHVGHARMLVAFDVIVRHLRASGLEVRFVRNVTDVDDKIIRRAAVEGITAEAVARKYEDAMAADLASLGVAPPDDEPRATAHIADIVTLIGRLIERGLAYPGAGGDVYFSVGSFPSYGALSGQSPDDLKAGARIEIDEAKQSPLDFALWKGAKPGEPQWDSPWGPGRPGWHIECSAMASRFLGETFDIHGGGADLIFPHHENERAQSEGAFGAGTFARHWLHSGMVNFGGEKMSKSLGNVVNIRRLAETHDLEALRLLLVSVHYRSP